MHSGSPAAVAVAIVHTHVVATLALVSVVSGRSPLTLSQTAQMLTHLELGRDGRHTVLSFLSPHLSSQWAILPRSSWIPIAARISLNQQSTKIRNIYISIDFFLNVKPLLLLFQKNQGLPSVQALLADPKSRKPYTQASAVRERVFTV